MVGHGGIGDNGAVTHDAFGYVLWVVVVVGVIVAVLTFVLSKDTYDQIGRGGLFEEDAPARPAGGSVAASGAERDAEIRQMLEARNARRVRRGEAPVDVEEELAALTRPAVDAGLLAEIRDLVEARNARRIRQGREPLDVEAEVARRIAELE
jgi:hypothetical protein